MVRLRLAQDAAAGADVRLTLGGIAAQRYVEFLDRDDRVRDFSVIIEDIRDPGGARRG